MDINNKDIASTAGNAIGGQVASGAIGIGLGMLQNDANKGLAEWQARTSYDYTTRLNNQMHNLQLDLFNQTGYGAQMKQLQDAGLNPALMYKNGGSSGQTNAVGQQQSTQMPQNQMLDAMDIASRIKVNEAQANLMNAQANKANADTLTTNKTRDILVENMRQSGIEQWFENIKTKMLREGYSNDDEVHVFKNLVYGVQAEGYNEDSPEVKKFNAELFKTVAEKANLDSSALLNNTKAENYWKELLIATKNADANMINAKANELAKEWETGEYTNWKTWADLAKDAVGAVSDLMKTGKTVNIKR